MIKTANEVISAMQMLENPEQREVLIGFFKTGKGQYGEGDEFLGLKVPETRAFVKEYRDLPLLEVQKLLGNKWHEVRLCGFLILVEQYNDKKATREAKDAVLNLYLANTKRANNWDLVDLSCYKILGKWLVESDATKAEKLKLMDKLANSDNLWFCTNSEKDVYKELQANPALELCGCKLEENEIQTPWIRFSAEAVFEERQDIRDAIIEKSSIVNALYSKMRENPIFKVFYLKNIDGWMTNLGNVKGLEKRAEFAKPIHFEF